MCEHKELGIDFTSKNIKNINDMIDHIKSINIDYNIIKQHILCEDISKNCINDINVDKEANINNINNQIVCSNFNDASLNNIFINDLNSLFDGYLNNTTISNFINNISIQNIPRNNMYISNDYSTNNISKILYPINNLENNCIHNIKESS